MRSSCLPAEIDPTTRRSDPAVPDRPVRAARPAGAARADRSIASCRSTTIPSRSRPMLGEAITLAVVLAGALKYDGVFTLQTKGDGPVRLMVADVSTEGAVRGYAQYDRDRLDAVPAQRCRSVAAARRCPSCSAPAISPSRSIRASDTERYQGIVELIGATLAECAQHYFRQSEQIQAGIKLSVARSGRERRVARRRADAAAGAARGRLQASIADDVEDGWRRAMVLMSSATAGRAGRPGIAAAPPAVPAVPRGRRAGVRDRTRSRRAAAARASASPASCAPSRRTTSRTCARTRSPP